MKYKIKRIRSRGRLIQKMCYVLCVILFFACIIFSNHYNKNKSSQFSGAFCVMLLCLCDMLEISVNKSVEVAVHNCLDVAVFVTCSCILGKSVGHKYVGADL